MAGTIGNYLYVQIGAGATFEETVSVEIQFRYPLANREGNPEQALDYIVGFVLAGRL